MITLLMLHAVLAEDTFEIATLQRENRELSQQEQTLREQGHAGRIVRRNR